LIWQGKCGGNRRVTLAKELVDPLKLQIDICKKYFDLDNNTSHYQGVWLPLALKNTVINLYSVLLALFYSYLDGRKNLSGTHATVRLPSH
jgi:hypothetical protein